MTISELIEKYIDDRDDREFVNGLTLEEQILYKCMLRDSLSFVFFSLHELISELVGELFESLDKLFKRIAGKGE